MPIDYWHDWDSSKDGIDGTASAEHAAIPLTRNTGTVPEAPAAPQQKPPAVPPAAPAKDSRRGLDLERAYDPDILNTDSNYPLARIIGGLTDFGKRLREGRNRVRNCCLLFYGPPGTGKTEFGKYLASKIDFGFTVRRGSDLLGEYVGQTEHAIKDLFEQAAKERTVVMIDEADTFLRNRAMSQREYEVSMTNELLCRMEEFSGIFICSTNMLSLFDPASMRRFIFKIRFRPLNAEGRALICRKMMSEVCELPDDLSGLEKLAGLTPGNFRTVRDRLMILNEGRVPFAEMVRELRLELSLGKAAGTVPRNRTERRKKIRNQA